MGTPFHAEVVTPEKVLFSGEVDEVSLRTDEGEITFLAHHAEFIGAVDISVVRLGVLPMEESAGGDQASAGAALFAVHGGFVHVAANTVTVLAGVAERGEDVDVARARAAADSASERLEREGPPRAPEGGELLRTEGEGAAGGDEGQPLSGARLALLAPSSAAAALRRALVRLEAAGAGGDAA